MIQMHQSRAKNENDKLDVIPFRSIVLSNVPFVMTKVKTIATLYFFSALMGKAVTNKSRHPLCRRLTPWDKTIVGRIRLVHQSTLENKKKI